MLTSVLRLIRLARFFAAVSELFQFFDRETDDIIISWFRANEVGRGEISRHARLDSMHALLELDRN